jgi:hypothetical protein
MQFRAARRLGVKWVFVSSLALCAAGACAGAVAEGGAPAAQRSDPSGEGWISAEIAATGPDAASDVRCPHGALEDPHRGFVRCLEPGEADAGGLPPAPQPEPPGDAGADSSPAPPADSGTDAPADAAVKGSPPAPQPIVVLNEPAFMNGEVPNVSKRLEKMTGDLGKCVADNGGLAGASGSIKLQFLVRPRGRAEGVEILSAKGVSAEAQRCVRLLLKDKSVGAPTADPVGVTITLSLRAAR